MHFFHKGVFLVAFLAWGMCAAAQAPPSYLLEDVDPAALRPADRQLLDSNLTQYHAATSDTLRLRALLRIADNCGDEQLWPRYNELLLRSAEDMLRQPGARPGAEIRRIRYYRAMALNNGGYVADLRGQTLQAIRLYHESLSEFRAIDDRFGMALTMNNIGTIRNALGESDSALLMFRQSLAVRQGIGNHQSIAVAMNNLGRLYQHLGELDSAAHYMLGAAECFRPLGKEHILQKILSNLGNIHLARKDYPAAESVLREAEALDAGPHGQEGAAAVGIGLAKLALARGRSQEARRVAQRAMTAAQTTGYPQIIMEAAGILEQLDRNLGNYRQALAWSDLRVQMRDSVVNAENRAELVRQSVRLGFEKQMVADSLAYAEAEALNLLEIERQEAEISRIKTTRAALIVFLLLLAVICAIVFLAFRAKQRSNRLIRTQNEKIEAERQKAEKLLLNILPAATAEELKTYGSAVPRPYANVSVLFADFAGFTALSERMTATELVAEIHHCFSAFDRILDGFEVEKIKTIGDAYMCAAGLPTTNPRHAATLVRAALAMQQFMRDYALERRQQGKPFFRMRIGIHSGPVIAGIVGTKKFAYDIWGDTVNTASRMESAAKVGSVNVSRNTYELIREDFDCRYRGKVEAKNKGMLDMFEVCGESISGIWRRAENTGSAMAG